MDRKASAVALATGEAWESVWVAVAPAALAPTRLWAHWGGVAAALSAGLADRRWVCRQLAATALVSSSL